MDDEGNKPLRPLKGHRALQRPRILQAETVATEAPQPVMKAVRDEKGRLLPGSNLNPLGLRPNPTTHVREALAKAQGYAPAAVDVLVALMDDEDARVRTIAAKEILTLGGAYREAAKLEADASVGVVPGEIDREKLIEMLRKVRKEDE